MHITETKRPFYRALSFPAFCVLPLPAFYVLSLSVFCALSFPADSIRQLCVTIAPPCNPKFPPKTRPQKNSKNYFGYLAEVFYFYHL